MRRSCVAVAAATVFAAALSLPVMARQVELGLPVEVSSSLASAEFDAAKAPDASTSTVNPRAARATVSDVAEPKSYALLLAGLGVLVYVARRRRLG
jgi:hypothetical protein